MEAAALGDQEERQASDATATEVEAARGEGEQAAEELVAAAEEGANAFVSAKAKLKILCESVDHMDVAGIEQELLKLHMGPKCRYRQAPDRATLRSRGRHHLLGREVFPS